MSALRQGSKDNLRRWLETCQIDSNGTNLPNWLRWHKFAPRPEGPCQRKWESGCGSCTVPIFFSLSIGGRPWKLPADRKWIIEPTWGHGEAELSSWSWTFYSWQTYAEIVDGVALQNLLSSKSPQQLRLIYPPTVMIYPQKMMIFPQSDIWSLRIMIYAFCRQLKRVAFCFFDKSISNLPELGVDYCCNTSQGWSSILVPCADTIASGRCLMDLTSRHQGEKSVVEKPWPSLCPPNNRIALLCNRPFDWGGQRENYVDELTWEADSPKMCILKERMTSMYKQCRNYEKWMLPSVTLWCRVTSVSKFFCCITQLV